MPTSLNLLDLFSNDPAAYGATSTLDMTQPAFANTLAAYKTTHQQALIGILSDVANSSINKDEFYLRMIFSYVTMILEAGLTPDPTNWTQQVDAIKSFAKKANIHDPTRSDYKNGARVQNGFGAWYEAVQDVPANTSITDNAYWLPVRTQNNLIKYFTTTPTTNVGASIFVEGQGQMHWDSTTSAYDKDYKFIYSGSAANNDALAEFFWDYSLQKYRITIKGKRLITAINTQQQFPFAQDFSTIIYGFLCSPYNSANGFTGTQGYAVNLTTGSVMCQSTVQVQYYVWGY